MAFQIDTSSINSATKRLNVIGNNVANANTVGFKGSDFDDILATSMSGDVGTKKAGARQSFTQGNITASSNPLDLAISGKGMFQVKDSGGGMAFTRNGQFSLDKDGNIVNATGDQLMGYAIDPTLQKPLSGTAVPLSISQKDYPHAATTSSVMEVNLDSRQPAIAAATTFNMADPSTYTHSTTTTVYSTKGEPIDVQTFFTKKPPSAALGTSTEWDVHVAVGNPPGSNQAITLDTKVWTLKFSASGVLESSASTASIKAGGRDVDFDFSKTVQYGTTFQATAVQNGVPAGELIGYKIGSDGMIATRYSNGKTTYQGQLALANFKSFEGLTPTENNQWVESSDSGPPQLRAPGEDGVGVLEASATEDANIDLTTEMIKMISAQRIYQAAAEMVKKSDEIMQTVVNIGN